MTTKKPSSRVSIGYGKVKKDGKSDINSNFSLDTRVQGGILKGLVNHGRHPAMLAAYACVSPLFTRPYRKRFTPQSMPVAASIAMDRYNGEWETDYYDNARAADFRFNRLYFGDALLEADFCMAWGSQACMWAMPITWWSYYYPPFFPDSVYPFVLFSNIDMTGSEIGPVYKHEIGAFFLFNDAGDTPASQGNLVTSGVFDPPSGLENHWTIQVYIATSGGTGISAGKSGSDGAVLASSPARFTSATAGFVLGDEGKYIKIQSGPNRGIYKIPTGGYVNGTTVDTDAVDINQDFSDESGIDWEMVTGPIGEYFIRVRPYSYEDTWASSFGPASGSQLAMNRLGYELGAVTNDFFHMPVRIVYDRGCCWWMVARHPTNDGNYCLVRWQHMSPYGMEVPVADSIITGSYPTDLYNYSDIAIDDEDKLWVGCVDATTTTERLFRIDPYPGTPKNGAAPALLASSSWGKQSDAASADGLTSDEVFGIVCDDSLAIVANTRVWVFCGDDGTTSGAGGIAYTDDYGVTWKRIHVLHSIAGETLTVTNGSANVTGGTSLDTKFAVGDWIRFGSDTRSYEVDARTATTMTLGTTYQGTNGSYSVQKGALAASEAELLRSGDFATQAESVDAAPPPPCDYDSSGRVYWIPTSRDKVCKWDESTGQVTTATATDLGQSRTVTDPTTLKVTRMPNVAGSGTTIWDDNIWVGCHDVTNGGWVRIQNANFEYVNDSGSISSFTDLGGTPNKVRVNTSSPHGLVDGVEVEITATGYNDAYVIENASGSQFDIVSAYTSGSGTYLVIVTRYHWLLTDNFPKTMDLTYDGEGCKSGWNILFEPTSGQIILQHNQGNSGACSLTSYFLDMYDGSTMTSMQNNTTMHTGQKNGGASVVPANWYSERMLGCMQFADNGLGQMFCVLFGYGLTEATSAWNYANAHLLSPIWICKRWDGSEWLNGPINAIDADIDFDGTPKVISTPTLGNGLRRVHDWDEELFAGVMASFSQKGSPTPQDEEYKQDESFTITNYYGTGKDNLAQADWEVDIHSSPTFYRLDEPVKDIENLWSSDGGIDGGYKESGAESDVILFARGPAELQEISGTGNSPYWQTNDWTSQVPDIFQLTAALRIADDHELDFDGGVTAGNQLTSSSYTFVSGDIGKTIILEGGWASNNIGQYVITGVAGSVATVTPNFGTNPDAAASGKRWKLRNIPKVAYVVLLVHRGQYMHENLAEGMRVKLYDSDTYGASWSLVKTFDPISSLAKNASLSQDNSFLNIEEFGGAEPGTNNMSGTCANSLWFDLTDLSGYSTGATRKQYWKIWKDHVSCPVARQFDVAGILLLDQNKNFLGRTSINKVEDADSSLFNGAYVANPMYVPYESVGTGVPTDDGDDYDDYTNLITASSDSFWEANETTGEVPSGGTNFKDTTYGQFTHQDIGKFIRINESGYADNGFHVITGWVSKDEVVTGSTGLTVQANLDWQLVTFGPGDFVRFESDTLVSSREGRALEDTYYEINDVPSNTTIELLNKELPRQIAGSLWNANFDINRDMTPASTFNDSSFDSGGQCYCRNRFGTVTYSTGIEFAEIDSGIDTNNTEEWPGIGGGILTVAAGAAPGDIRVETDAAHGRTAGENVAITGTTNYNGVYTITLVSDATHFDVTDTFVATETGEWDFYQDTDSDGRVDAIKIEKVLDGKDGAFSAVADNGSGKARFTTTAAHGMAVGDYVIIYNSTKYSGRYIIITVSDTTHFDVDTSSTPGTDTGDFSSVIGPGDYILLYGSSAYGRRVLEIRDIERDSSRTETDIRVTYDELIPEDSFTNWVIYTRRSWLKSAMRRTIVITHET